MNEAEALQKIEELKEFIKNKDKVILVPDCIKIERCGESFWDNLHIVFSDWKKSLSYYNKIKDYLVGAIDLDLDLVKCKLVKVDEPKEWYTYYHSGEWLYDINELSCYCKYLWGDKYVSIKEETDVIINSNSRKDCYQVVPLD